ncbi:hypothetical protein IP88_15075 [alpha proteobacterium AAP81b]|nr:hypothetical protein IP88_15075 [alpha proteobacterium AAP81b]
MRKWHRWLSVVFGVVLLWIAGTGLLSQVVPLLAPKSPPVAPAVAPAFVCPPDYNCRPKPRPGDPRALVGLLHHLHSGESFGPVGVAIATLAGVAMLFFTLSGLWMYVVMWRARARRAARPAWFWR